MGGGGLREGGREGGRGYLLGLNGLLLEDVWERGSAYVEPHVLAKKVTHVDGIHHDLYLCVSQHTDTPLHTHTHTHTQCHLTSPSIWLAIVRS